MNTNVSQIGRGLVRVSYAGGSSASLFWAYTGSVGVADGDNPLNQAAMPWNGSVRMATLYCTNDPGIVTIGVHIDRSPTALFSATIAAPGADSITKVQLQGAFSSGQEIGFSVAPTNDPGASYLIIATQFDGPGGL